MTNSDGFAPVATLDEEQKKWKSKLDASRSRQEREEIKSVYEVLDSINIELKAINTWSSGSDVLSVVFECIDDLWKLGEEQYSQASIINLINAVAYHIIIIIVDEFRGISIFDPSVANLDQVVALLQWGSALCIKFDDLRRNLINVLWANQDRKVDSSHPEISIAKKYSQRLDEILQVRNVHRQLTFLLSTEECDCLRPSVSFSPFSELNPIDYESSSNSSWLDAVLRFEKIIAPAEKLISGKLQARLSPDFNVLLLLQEYKRYKELIKRPNLSNHLRPNREQFILSLINLTSNLKNDLESKDVFKIGAGCTSEAVISIYHARQICHKIKDIEQVAKLCLQDLTSYPSLLEQLQDVASAVKQFERRSFKNWVDTITKAIRTDNLTLKTDDNVIEFTEGLRLMEVTYNPKLTNLIEETQELSVLGFRIPSEIASLATTAKKFIKYARELDQIANFHNTIGDRMIPSQRPMMLETAVALSKMVQNQEGITWSNITDVHGYIDNLKHLVLVLSRQNTKLTYLHNQMKTKVALLFETDLLKLQSKWKDILKEVRNIFKQVELQGFKNTKSWQKHWEYQLYKALEVQYVMGIASLNENLPPIEVELVYRQQKLQFKPPLEEIRMKYYANVKKFLSIPLFFRGLSDENSEELIYPALIDRHSVRFQKIYDEGEKCLDKVAAVKDRFEEWVALGDADIDFLSKHLLNSWEDWDLNFRVSKNKGQEIARLPCSDEHIGCFVVTFGLLRLEIELLNRKYWEVLSTLLHNSIFGEMATAEAFLSDSIAKLKEDPKSVQEIAQANVLKERLTTELPKIRLILESLDKKNKTLSTWTKERHDVTRIKVLWENFQSMMDNHHAVIGRQVESIKMNLKTQIQSVNHDLEHFKLRWDELKPKDADIMQNRNKFEETIEFMREKRKEWAELSERLNTLSESCENIQMEPAEFPLLSDIEKDLNSFEQMWSKIEEFQTGLKEFEQEDWIIFRAKPYRFEEYLQLWAEKFRTEPKSDFIIRALKDIESYKTIIPNLRLIRGDTFSEKHWFEMFNLLGIPNKPLAVLKVSDFLQVRENINDHVKDLKELNTRASGEITVRQALSELDAWEIEAKFNLSEATDSQNKTMFIIQDFKSVLNKLGDNQSLLQSIKTSPYYSHFADRISMWETRLADLDEYLQNLNRIQRRWVYLEPIFSHGVLDTEQQRFKRIDDDFRNIMLTVSKDPRVICLCKLQGIRNRLNILLDQLSRCQNSLNEFLERKRSGFPRFYFLGDDDLLEILGQSTKPSVIQAHLKKLFAGIHNVDFDSDFQHIITMKSLEGEVVPLKSKVKVTSNVEEWLSELSNEMKYTLKSSLLDCVSDTKHDIRNPDKYPSQILSLCNSIVFTDRCEEAIRSSHLPDLLTQLKEELDTYTNVNIGESHPSPMVMEMKLKELILDVIHEIEVAEFLISCKARNVNEWVWQKQLRFYIKEDGSATVKMADAEFAYSYEYQGNAQKLVHTPLTDKCYLTLTQGMRMGLGGNPYGPAGTGKTESVKALGGLLGRQVLVFNCDEGIDVKAMGRIFIGLVKCGAWGCFDEFNRLEGATLSAVSMQIQPIQTALKLNSPNVVLMGELVSLDSNAGIFVTMNPAGKGYGGRNKLPDNLKQLFRPVVMSQPDNELIAEVILFTEGFKQAKKIGRKLVEVFKLSSKLLSPQTHYDWGLRALKTVLKGCGSALKEVKKTKNTLTDKDESDTVVSTLRLNTLPKLTYLDCFRFDSLIKDVFSDVTFKDLGYNELADMVRESYDDLKLQINENQVRKCLELFEQLQQRMGVVIVGPPCSGKSTICSLLKHALLKMGKKVKAHVMNPKAMPRSHLLGHINLDTRQWTDGVLTMKAQQVYSEPPDVTSWIVCDGDIDPEWIESLNSVLDDNRLLTLPSGWRIKFGPNVNFVFETHDLSYASPATISRMGMIFLSEEDSDIQGVIKAWILQESPENQSHLGQMMDDYFYQGLQWTLAQTDLVVTLPTVSITKNVISQMKGVTSVSELSVAMIRGFGGHLNEKIRLLLSKQILSSTQQPIATQNGSIVNLYYNASSDRVEFYEDEDLSGVNEFNFLSPPLVKTADVKRVLNHLKPWLENQESFILIGPEGCGKTMILEYAFNELRSTNVATIHCSSLISPENVLQKLSQMCITITTNSGRVYKSKDGERLILYFKDINLVKPDKWGTCQLIEFVQQIISYDGFYDQNLEWVGVQGIQVVASITTGSTGGRYNLSPRFLSSIRVCTTNQPEQQQLISIYKNYFRLLLKTKFPNHKLNNNTKFSTQVASCMVIAFDEIRSTFTQVMNSHYQFTPRDLTKWIFGIMRYNLDVIEFSDEQDIVQAWTAEANRLFRDKLVSTVDKEKFDSIIESTLINEWGVKDMTEKIKGFQWISGLSLSTTAPSPDIILNSSLGSTMYKRNSSDLVETIEKGITTFARENRDLNIVILPEVLENVIHFDRILSFPSASMVLAGRAGIGRRSAISIVSALHRATLFTLKVGRNYSLKSFKMDLKAAIQLSAVEGNRVFFVVEDYQLVNVIFLDMINSLLSSGEIPGLYSTEELEIIISSLREVASSEGYPASLYSYFAARVKRLMQIILIMDYTSEQFIVNCESNPAIYKLCNFVWLDNWSESSLRAIPPLMIKKFYGQSDDSEEGIATAGNIDEKFVVDGFQYIYSTLEEKLTYPRRYFNFVHTYAILFLQKRKKILDQISRLKAGVSKLIEAKDIVEKLKAEASVQEETLAEKQAEANNALELITETMRNANVQRSEMEDLREKTLHENEILLAKKGSIDEELKEIEPLVRMAQASVGNIKSEAISEIRSLRAPPDVIRDILEGVLQLMGIRDMSWNNMKTFLSKRGIKDEIKTFDARKIRTEDRDSVEKLLKTKGESFEMKNAKRASAAAAPLAEWVVANVKFSRVLEKIEPLETQQRNLERNLKMAEGQIGKLSSELVDVDQRVQELKSRLNQYTKEAAEIEFHLTKAKDTLVAAEGLVGKLLDEFTRWNMELQDLSNRLNELPMYTLVAAAFMTYLCNATETYRKNCISQWTESMRVERFDFCSYLSTERDILQWQALGLPTDLLSQENAIIIMNLMNGKVGTCLRPYLIDPSGRATEWLKNLLASENQNPTILSLQDPKFPTELELAIRFGKVLIIMEADTVEPILIPVLRGNLISQGSRETVQVGDKQVDYNPDFRLYLSTRNPNPILPPDAAAVLTVVNFTTTKAGLTSQLLTTTLSHEKPEIELKKNELLKNVESLKIQLDKLEETLLHELASATGNILENKELLLSLNQTKANSMAITQSLSDSSVLQLALDQETNVYLTLAQFGSQLYFAILDAAKLNNLYQFSLSSFIQLFVKILKVPSRGGSTDARIVTLMKDLEKSVYEYVCRSMFKCDRLSFALHLAHEMHGKLYQANEWECFIGALVSGVKIDPVEGYKSLVPGWINEDRHVAVYSISSSFPKLYDKLSFGEEALWADFYSSVECEDKIPKEIKESITPFEILLVIQSLRPDRLQTAMTNFSRLALGRKSLFPPPASLRQVLLDTIAAEPVLILLSSGADPSQELKELALHTVGSEKYFEMSMGQGQSEIALEKLREAAQLGTWVCMKNLHLVTHWLDTLEKEIQALNPHENFRLWLTSEPHHQFPNILAQSCLKVAYEAPQGLKKNLQRTYGNWSKDYLVGDKNILRTQSLFVLAFFHAVVQERRTYIPQGWSKVYEFNESDLRAGADVLDQMFKGSRAKEIQWGYVHGLFENAIYGGRVDNIYDNRVLVSYLHDYFNDAILTGANPSGKTLGPSLKVPSTTNPQDYINLIESVPEYDKPSSFGLPSNIERSWQRITSAQVLNQLKTLSRSFNDMDSFDRKLWHQELSPVLSLWKKINQGRGAVELLQKKAVPPSLDGENKSLNPIEAFVLLENYNSLIFLQSVHRKLGEISKTIRGMMIPTAETVEIADSLMKRETPTRWLKIWEGPSESLAYLQGIVVRASAINRWKGELSNESLLSNPIDLSDLFNPDTFLSAFKQYCARKMGVSMDELSFACSWDRHHGFPDNLSCQLTGLLLEGCSFNNGKLIENNSESLPIVRIPDCTVTWTKTGDGRRKYDIISLPLYYNEAREKIIGCLDLPSYGEKGKWIQAGVALFLKT